MALPKIDMTPQSSPSNFKAQGNVALGLSEFKRIARMMKDDAGITMHEHKVNLVHARLQKRLRALQIQSFKEYCNFVEGSSGQAERKIMMNALTTNLTHFFREPHHFKHLLDVSLRPLIERVKSGKRVRVWSAGCSTGEEAYSIASIVHSICPDIERYNFKILASDIDSNVIRTGHTGIYDKSSVRKLPSKFRDRYFKQMDDPEKFVVSDELKSLVSFRLLNLNAPNWPMKGKFDIIFCRNTVIYFDEETQGEIWTKFKNQLNPSSYLYIGHSERVSGPSEKFFARAGMTVYKLEN